MVGKRLTNYKGLFLYSGKPQFPEKSNSTYVTYSNCIIIRDGHETFIPAVLIDPKIDIINDEDGDLYEAEERAQDAADEYFELGDTFDRILIDTHNGRILAQRNDAEEGGEHTNNLYVLAVDFE
jgi:hypothetical protein